MINDLITYKWSGKYYLIKVLGRFLFTLVDKEFGVKKILFGQKY